MITRSTPKTSISHPLEIAEVHTPAGGRIGLTFCPGKKQNTALSGMWDRDLGLDLDAIKAWGATVVLTLIEDHEIVTLGVGALGTEVAARGIVWHHLPIKDVSVPDRLFETAYDGISPDLHRRLAAREAVLVHCKGGLGRAGLVAARLLVEQGHKAQDAIYLVRSVRSGAIETLAQEDYLRTQAWRAAADR